MGGYSCFLLLLMQGGNFNSCLGLVGSLQGVGRCGGLGPTVFPLKINNYSGAH